MITINKAPEPDSFRKLKKRRPDLTYRKLHKFPAVQTDVQLSLLKEQGYLCCFCGSRIGANDSFGVFVPLPPHTKPKRVHGGIEHLIPKSTPAGKLLELDYSNLCYSCAAQQGTPREYFDHCNHFKGDNLIPILPTHTSCLDNFIFAYDGVVSPNSQSNADAIVTIAALNLNAGRLVVKRNAFIKGLMQAMKIIKNTKQLLANFLKVEPDGARKEFYFIAVKYLGKFCS